jgi:hypothetical protein
MRNACGQTDIVYLFSRITHSDEELLYSLRSVAVNLPWVRNVWIFGDRPDWMSEDKSTIEHVSQNYIARALGCPSPVTNDFLMLFMATLIPGLAFDFVRFSDDYIVLQPLTREELCTVRVQEELSQVPVRGSSQFQDMLWHTYDVLKQYGYPGYNFDDHVPMPYTRQIVFEAFCAFRDFITPERYRGMLSGMTICNYAAKHHGLKFLGPETPSFRAGFYFTPPATVAEVAAACEGKRFLNFDDAAYGPALQAFLADRFPDKCKYER